jgi:hypothetical protein
MLKKRKKEGLGSVLELKTYPETNYSLKIFQWMWVMWHMSIKCSTVGKERISLNIMWRKYQFISIIAPHFISYSKKQSYSIISDSVGIILPTLGGCSCTNDRKYVYWLYLRHNALTECINKQYMNTEKLRLVDTSHGTITQNDQVLWVAFTLQIATVQGCT